MITRDYEADRILKYFKIRYLYDLTCGTYRVRSIE